MKNKMLTPYAAKLFHKQEVLAREQILHEKAEGEDLKINLKFSDNQESFVLHIKNSVLHHHAGPAAADAAATLTLTKPFFLNMMTGEAGATDLIFSSDTKIDGSTLKLGKFFGMLDKATGNFNIVTP